MSDGTVQGVPNMQKLKMHDGFVRDFRIIYRLHVLNWNHEVHEFFFSISQKKSILLILCSNDKTEF